MLKMSVNCSYFSIDVSIFRVLKEPGAFCCSSRADYYISHIKRYLAALTVQLLRLAPSGTVSNVQGHFSNTQRVL